MAANPGCEVTIPYHLFLTRLPPKLPKEEVEAALSVELSSRCVNFLAISVVPQSAWKNKGYGFVALSGSPTEAEVDALVAALDENIRVAGKAVHFRACQTKVTATLPTVSTSKLKGWDQEAGQITRVCAQVLHCYFTRRKHQQVYKAGKLLALLSMSVAPSCCQEPKPIPMWGRAVYGSLEKMFLAIGDNHFGGGWSFQGVIANRNATIFVGNSRNMHGWDAARDLLPIATLLRLIGSKQRLDGMHTPGSGSGFSTPTICQRGSDCGSYSAMASTEQLSCNQSEASWSLRFLYTVTAAAGYETTPSSKRTYTNSLCTPLAHDMEGAMLCGATPLLSSSAMTPMLPPSAADCTPQPRCSVVGSRAQETAETAVASGISGTLSQEAISTMMPAGPHQERLALSPLPCASSPARFMVGPEKADGDTIRASSSACNISTSSTSTSSSSICTSTGTSSTTSTNITSTGTSGTSSTCNGHTAGASVLVCARGSNPVQTRGGCGPSSGSPQYGSRDSRRSSGISRGCYNGGSSEVFAAGSCSAGGGSCPPRKTVQPPLPHPLSQQRQQPDQQQQQRRQQGLQPQQQEHERSPDALPDDARPFEAAEEPPSQAVAAAHHGGSTVSCKTPSARDLLDICGRRLKTLFRRHPGQISYRVEDVASYLSHSRDVVGWGGNARYFSLEGYACAVYGSFEDFILELCHVHLQDTSLCFVGRQRPGEARIMLCAPRLKL